MTTFRSGNGAAWLDLLSTREGRYRTADRHRDRISSAAALGEWLAANGLAPARAVGAADVERFAQVREALHRVAVAVVGGAGARAGVAAVGAGDVRVIGDALAADSGLRVARGADGLLVRRPATAQEALARLTRAAVEDLTGPRRAQLRACGDDTCAGIFFDPTGRRRWCTDQSCGNRLRVRAHRARVTDGEGVGGSV
ncbi:CGNR zinc finger domain-containing protein [Gryllotalpicola daejeonensis]|uniref:CGNR zinc finger domain-containing protein n=1 Tax=Gryllotalpicola daejeonensis TaxID=993087 RepID=A0ABP7ZMX1_9MICO